MNFRMEVRIVIKIELEKQKKWRVEINLPKRKYILSGQT